MQQGTRLWSGRCSRKCLLCHEIELLSLCNAPTIRDSLLPAPRKSLPTAAILVLSRQLPTRLNAAILNGVLFFSKKVKWLMYTRTGNFPIGWRRRNFNWENDLDGMIAWAKANDLSVIDVGRDGETSGKAVVDAGLKVGTADLPVWEAMISPDKGKRKDAVAQNAEYIKNTAAFGVRNYFMCMLPEKRDGNRAENFGYMVESYSELAPTFEAHDAHLVIEG